MMQILYKLQIVNIIFTLSLYTESMKTLLFMFIITFLIKPIQLSTVYFILFLCSARLCFFSSVRPERAEALSPGHRPG